MPPRPIKRVRLSARPLSLTGLRELTADRNSDLVVLGLAASLVSLGVGLFAFRAGDAHWQTLLFTTLIFSSLALAVGVRAEKEPFWKRPLSNPALLGALVLTVALQLAAVYVPFLQRILRTTALPSRDLLAAFAAGAVVLVAVEVWKWMLRRPSAERSPNS